MTPIVVIPGLYATPRFYEAQLAELWQRGPQCAVVLERACRHIGMTVWLAHAEP